MKRFQCCSDALVCSYEAACLFARSAATKPWTAPGWAIHGKIHEHSRDDITWYNHQYFQAFEATHWHMFKQSQELIRYCVNLRPKFSIYYIILSYIEIRSFPQLLRRCLMVPPKPSKQWFLAQLQDAPAPCSTTQPSTPRIALRPGWRIVVEQLGSDGQSMWGRGAEFTMVYHS